LQDKFVGTYDLSVESNVTVVNGSNKSQLDLNEPSAMIRISPLSNSQDEVLVTGYYGERRAKIINSKQIKFAATSNDNYTIPLNGGIMYVYTSHQVATLEGNTLKWSTTVDVAGMAGSSTFGGGGVLNNIARKMN
jgi:hypothetical protein